MRSLDRLVEKIRETFFKRFDPIFLMENPPTNEVAKIFYWLKSEATNARYFEHLREIDDLRREAEMNFSKFDYLRKKVDKESKKVNEAIRKRDEQLRTTRSKKKGKIPLVGAETERDRVPPVE